MNIARNILCATALGYLMVGQISVANAKHLTGAEKGEIRNECKADVGKGKHNHEAMKACRMRKKAELRG